MSDEILNDKDSTEDEYSIVETTPNEIDVLKARADMLGVLYHPNIGLEKLRHKVTAAMSDKKNTIPTSPITTKADVVDATPVETDMQRRVRKRKEATALVRIRIQCMNPNKKDWPGEIISVGNNLVGSLSKYIPFSDTEDGWHVPRMLYEHLLDRHCQVFTTKIDDRGNKSRTGKLIREFSIEVLPDLTTEELKELAQRQAMAKSID